MSTWPEKRTVLLALEDSRSHRIDGYKWPEAVANATPRHMGRTAEGKLAQPMGVRRVRAILNELVDDGCAERIRSHFGGHAWRITTKGADRARRASRKRDDVTSSEHEQVGMTETAAERESRRFEARVAFVAAAITSPNAQSQTKRKMRKYARRAVQALDAYEAQVNDTPINRAMAKVSAREPFTQEELDELAGLPSVRRIVVSHAVVGGSILWRVDMGYSEGSKFDGRAAIVYSDREM